jgi:preprotein translocase subunit SecA
MDRLLRLGEGKLLKQLGNVAKQVNAIEDDFVAMNDDELRGQTDEFRARYEKGETLESLLPEAFATVREASRRVLDKRHFDVQVMGGAALHMGNIAEMKTGEGKTLVATMPSYLNALTGRGVHIVTVNDYLAKRDSEWMGRIHHFLGLDVGAILSQMTPADRRKAYHADITYGTNNEFGFDYLRDNMALSLEDCVQHGHNYAIVDEVDSILIDEARTPLIISGPAEDTVKWYPEFAKLVNRLRRDDHYEVDEKKRTVAINEAGIDAVEDWLGIHNLYESANTPLISYLNNAIKAKELFKLDRDYVVINDEVLIVDEHTGRTLIGRRYNEGLHQAIEAKESVQIREEYQTLATISLQNYFRMYDKLAGMTGTAMTEASEFQKIYGLGVVPIPTNMPMIRGDQRDLIYRTEEAKFEAIVEDVAERHQKGQPVLIGTASVAKSEILSGLLKHAGVKHEVLNAKQHEREAAIIAMAGAKAAVTVATNMAGRGTDIILGGNAEFLADKKLHDSGIDALENSEEYEKLYPELLEDLEKETQVGHDEVVELGGLYVVGSERHESRRIDNQLRGRSGRQGDPGASRFYLSLGDDLMRLFKSDIVDWVLQALKMPDDVPIENKRVTASIASAQIPVEAENFAI